MRLTASAMETRIFWAVTGLAALHVADDNFLQPPSGTSALDHAPSGLLPLALLGAAAWGYPRLRAGARAALSAAVGFFTLFLGVFEAGYHTMTIGPRGDDYTGLLCIPAAL